MQNDTPQYVTDLARQFRKNQTEAEKVLWEAIRNGKLGVKFRRQHAFGRYIVDYYCHEKKLVLEIDGGIHNLPDVMEYDRIRQNEIESRGLRVIRVKNEEILSDLQGVTDKILRLLE